MLSPPDLEEVYFQVFQAYSFTNSSPPEINQLRYNTCKLRWISLSFWHSFWEILRNLAVSIVVRRIAFQKRYSPSRSRSQKRTSERSRCAGTDSNLARLNAHRLCTSRCTSALNLTWVGVVQPRIGTSGLAVRNKSSMSPPFLKIHFQFHPPLFCFAAFGYTLHALGEYSFLEPPSVPLMRHFGRLITAWRQLHPVNEGLSGCGANLIRLTTRLNHSSRIHQRTLMKSSKP